MSLKNKRILITAGPTWVAIDKVRVISNIASGQTGKLLSKEAERAGAKVTLLLGPVAGDCCLGHSARIIRFKFFDELKELMLKELSFHKYDAVIHCAAVADYRPKRSYMGKIGSGRKELSLRLEPTPKIIDIIRRADHSLILVAFKFEPQAAKVELIKKARTLLKRSGADVVVANTADHNRYKAYIVREDAVRGAIFTKEALSKALISEIGARICRN